VELMEKFGRNIAKNGTMELDNEGEPIQLLAMLGEGTVSDLQSLSFSLHTHTQSLPHTQPN
jgi:hypothetical protein